MAAFAPRLARDAMREARHRRPRRMMPLERTGAFTLGRIFFSPGVPQSPLAVGGRP
jgi:hypothetical protein